MSIKKLTGSVFSVLLHILILSIFLSMTVASPPPKKEAKKLVDDEYYPLTVTLIPMEKPSEESEILKGNKDALLYPTDSTICSDKDNTYRGIGIIRNFGSQLITHAPEFYPAYKAGIRIGDRVINLQEKGEYVDVTVMRGNNKLFFHVKEDNICYNLK